MTMNKIQLSNKKINKSVRYVKLQQDLFCSPECRQSESDILQMIKYVIDNLEYCKEINRFDYDSVLKLYDQIAQEFQYAFRMFIYDQTGQRF